MSNYQTFLQSAAEPSWWAAFPIMAAVLWTARIYEEKFSRCLFNIVFHLTYWAGLGMTGPVSSIRITEEKDTARSHPNLADTLPKQKKVGSWTFSQQLNFRHLLLNVLHILDHLATLLYEPQHVTVHQCVVKTRSPRNVWILQSTLSSSSAEGPANGITYSCLSHRKRTLARVY